MSTLRLARFLARAGACSRRGAADLVTAGRVRINGKPPVGPGDPVDPAADRVTLDGRPLQLAAGQWIVMNKPPGVETSRRASERHPSVFGLLPDAPTALVSVGRLDVLSEGLLLFTTDGEAANRLMHPRYQVERTYRVFVTGKPRASAREVLVRGVALDEGPPARPTAWTYTPGEGGGEIEVTLGEGRSRVVRRMLAALGCGVRRLVRESYGPIRLGNLPSGKARPLTAREIAALYAALGLAAPAAG